MTLPVWPHAEPPFHPGERAVQTRAGSAERMAEIGPRVMRAVMPDQHREFFPLLPFVALGAVDAGGQPWASVLTGAQAGFVTSPDEASLQVQALPGRDDPLASLLRPGAALGLLGIELPTRRRNRANGRIVELRDGGFTLAVEQSFGNCPKYIQRRALLPAHVAATPAAAQRMTQLDAPARALVRGADTFFVATHAAGDLASGGTDVSHRGGRPGFVRVSDDGRVLTWPDFAGNRFFNTLGNLALESRAGLLFADFERGDLLHVAGQAEVVWEGADLRGFEGAERLVRLQVSEAVWRPGAWALRWTLVDTSPALAGTGVW